MDGFMTLHDVMHHTRVKKEIGIILKLDFEKAYGEVTWDFLLECHKLKGFVNCGANGRFFYSMVL
jgi:hypothetical protein